MDANVGQSFEHKNKEERGTYNSRRHADKKECYSGYSLKPWR